MGGSPDGTVTVDQEVSDASKDDLINEEYRVIISG